MPRAAQDVMQSLIFSAVLDAIAALKSASGNLPNNLLRQVQAIHGNVTMADLPKELQDAIAASTRAAFAGLLKEGYSVAPRDAGPARPAPRQGEVVARGVDRSSPSPSRGPRSDAPRGRRGDRPSGGPQRGPRGDRPSGSPPRGPRGPRTPRQG
jgi:type II secretory pathway component HofQ